MTRTKTVFNAATGQTSVVNLTSEEEAARDAEEAASAAMMRPLEKWRVWAIAEINGLDVLGAIDGLSNATAKAVAKAKWNDPPGGYFDRDDPLFSNADLLAALNVDSDAIDALWASAQGLS